MLPGCHRIDCMAADGVVMQADTLSDLASYCQNLKDSANPFFGTQQRARLLAELQDPTFGTDSWRISITRELARDHLRFGEAEEAIRLLTEALDAERRGSRSERHQAVLLQDLSLIHI